MKNPNGKRRLVLMFIMLVFITGLVFLFVSSGDAGLNEHEAKDYIATHHVEDTTAHNAVTAVYLNYRLFDTLFESLILLVSVLAVITLSWNTDRQD